MAALTDTTIASTYKQLLKITSEGVGADASAKYVEDGLGTDTALSLSTTRAGIGTASPSNQLHLESATSTTMLMKNTGNSGSQIDGDANRSSADSTIMGIVGKWNGTSVGDMLIVSGSDTTNKDDGEFVFRTAPSGSLIERLRIKANGAVQFGSSGGTGDIYHYGTGKFAINDSAGSASTPTYAFNSDVDTGMYRGAADTLRFATGGAERIEVTSAQTKITGQFKVDAPTGDDTYAQFYSNRSTDGQLIHTTAFVALNTASSPEATTYADMRVNIVDNSDSTEDGSITFRTMKAGTLTEHITLESDSVVKSTGGIYFTGTGLAGADTGISSSGHGGDLRFYVNGTNHMALSESSSNAFLNINNNDTGSAGSTLKQLSLGKSDNTGWDTTNTGTFTGLAISNAHPDGGTACGIQFSHHAASSGLSYIVSRAERAYSSGGDRSSLHFGTRGSDGVQRRMIIGDAGVITMSNVYGRAVGTTKRAVYVGDGGDLGYDSSVREHKMDITSLSDVSWVNDLNPVSFYRRNQNEDGTYGKTKNGNIEYGLIADEVEKVNKDFVFYNKDEDGNESLAGVEYRQLMIPMLKKIQELEAELQDLKDYVDHKQDYNSMAGRINSCEARIGHLEKT